jgi:hypothetical protein
MSFDAESATPQFPQDVSVPFDVSHADRSIVTDVKIADHRSYDLYLAVYYKDDVDLHRVMQLTGDGSKSKDGLRYGRPGVVIPIHVKVVNNSGAVIYDHIQDAQGIDAHIFGKNHDGYFLRGIGGVALRPGVYRIEVNTIEDTPEYANEHCSFFMGWKPNASALHD